MKVQITMFAAAACLLASSTMQAATVAVNLGASGQNFVLTGHGANGGGNGTYTIQQGACSSAAGLTTCTLSGSIVAAGSSAGFTSGTYSFVTTYATADVNPIQGVSQSPGSNSFVYSFLAPDVSMVLNLTTPGGNYVEPAVTGGAFTGVGFSFAYTGVETCTVVAVCTQANVGITNGATISGPVTMATSFTIPDATTPEPTTLALSGLSVLALAAFAKRRKQAA